MIAWRNLLRYNLFLYFFKTEKNSSILKNWVMKKQAYFMPLHPRTFFEGYCEFLCAPRMEGLPAL
jgi:hypothetical protein